MRSSLQEEIASAAAISPSAIVLFVAPSVSVSQHCSINVKRLSSKQCEERAAGGGSFVDTVDRYEKVAKRNHRRPKEVGV